MSITPAAATPTATPSAPSRESAPPARAPEASAPSPEPALDARAEAPVGVAGAGHPARAIELLRDALGVPDERARVLLEDRAFRRAARLFARTAAPDAAAQCRRYLIANTDADVAWRASDDPLALARDYARSLGYRDLVVARDHVTLIGADGAAIDAGSAKGGGQDALASARALARLVNLKRFETEVAAPPVLPIDVSSVGFALETAHMTAHLSLLAYDERAHIEAQLAAWGFDMRTFGWIEDTTTKTEGFVCADGQGHIHVCFPGTASGRDVVTDASARLVAPAWAPPGSGIEVHEGVNKAVEAIWSQVVPALEHARSIAGAAAKVVGAGHSLGGGIAGAVVARAKAERLIADEGAVIVTDGALRIGNEALQLYLEARFSSLWRIARKRRGGIGFDFDPIVGLPPKAMGYRHFGNLVELYDDAINVIPVGAAGARRAFDARVMGALAASAPESAAAPARDDPADPADPIAETLRGADLEKYTRAALRLAEVARSDGPTAALESAQRAMGDARAEIEAVVARAHGRVREELRAHTRRATTARVDLEAVAAHIGARMRAPPAAAEAPASVMMFGFELHKMSGYYSRLRDRLLESLDGISAR